jgi:hypothetical protein
MGWPTRRERIAAAALAIGLAALAPDASAGKIDLFPYEHSGPFVQYPALAVGSVFALPVALVAGAVSAPVLALTCNERCGSLGREVGERAFFIGYVAGVPAAVVAGLPFLGLKTLFWTLPSSFVASRPAAPADDPAPAPAPARQTPRPPPDDSWGARG